MSCYWAGVFGWALALLTDQPWLFFYGSGYVASLCQVGTCFDFFMTGYAPQHCVPLVYAGVSRLTLMCLCVHGSVSVSVSLCPCLLRSQGVAHEQTGERANLPELALRSGPEKAADEHAHTAFFPSLILHSARESLFGLPPQRRPETSKAQEGH